MNITTVGIDLAENVFQVHGVDERGQVLLRKAVKRSELAQMFANLPSCLIGMEACGSAHYWARRLMEYGHTVKLMAPQFVKLYVKTNKNDAAWKVICEAVAQHAIRAGEERGAAAFWPCIEYGGVCVWSARPSEPDSGLL